MFHIPRINHLRQLESADASPYSTTRRKLSLLCTSLGDAAGESYTLHSPKNLFPAVGNQMDFNQKELNIIGHWSSSSKMPERYDRAVCATELLLRNTIIPNFVSGWSLAPSSHLPLTVPNDLRIGKTPEETIPPTAPRSTADSSAVVQDDTQATEVALTQAIPAVESDDSASREKSE